MSRPTEHTQAGRLSSCASGDMRRAMNMQGPHLQCWAEDDRQPNHADAARGGGPRHAGVSISLKHPKSSSNSAAAGGRCAGREARLTHTSGSLAGARYCVSQPSLSQTRRDTCRGCGGHSEWCDSRESAATFSFRPNAADQCGAFLPAVAATAAGRAHSSQHAGRYFIQALPAPITQLDDFTHVRTSSNPVSQQHEIGRGVTDR